MIYRYGVTCPGCDAKILLRVSVGADDVEPFFYVCAKCRTPTKVVQHLIYKPVPHTRLELEAGEEFDGKEAPADCQTITIHPEFPSVPDATEMWDTGGSPFTYQYELVGSNFLELVHRMSNFRGRIDTNWTTFRRFARFYALKDWQRFDAHGRKLMAETWPASMTELHRHDMFHKLLSILFQPILVPPFLPEGKEELNSKLASGSPSPALKQFCASRITNGTIDRLHHDLLERLDFVAHNKTAMLCVLPLEFYSKGSEAATADLRLFRDEFTLLKTHYIDSYELAHKVLGLIVGVLNCVERGSPNKFDPRILRTFATSNIKQFASLNDLARFEKLPNAPKRAFLSPLPKWQSLWDETLSPKLRNPIGHHSARHDLVTGQVIIDGGRSVSYLKFAFETFRLTHLHLLSLHVLKMMQMIPHFRA